MCGEDQSSQETDLKALAARDKIMKELASAVPTSSPFPRPPIQRPTVNDIIDGSIEGAVNSAGLTSAYGDVRYVLKRMVQLILEEIGRETY